jgi:hypothetical protein
MAARIVRAMMVVGVASSLRKSRKEDPSNAVMVETPEVRAQLEPQLSTLGDCSAPRVVKAVRWLANKLIDTVVKPSDPVGFNFPDVNKQVKLLGCSLSVQINTSLTLSGHGDPKISEIKCKAYECIKPGLIWGCRKAIYDFDFGLIMPDEVRLDGTALGDWRLCGMQVRDGTTTIGGGVVSPGLFTKVRAEYDSGWTGILPRTEIKQVLDLRVDAGEHAGTTCGFSGLPNFIGSRLESWCESFGDWLFGKTRDTAGPLINNALKKMIGQIVEEDERGGLHLVE